MLLVLKVMHTSEKIRVSGHGGVQSAQVDILNRETDQVRKHCEGEI